jgi:biotin carboxyl carrier protein
MNVDVMVNGRPWKVAVEPAGQAGTYTVTIKGKSRMVDASWIDADTLSLIDGNTAREIRLHAREATGAVGVEFSGKLYEAVVVPPEAKKRNRDPFPAFGSANKDPDSFSTAGALEPASIKTPMPGRVVRVLVAVGDRVTAGQGVAVVEAMKMENDLRTPRDGVVTEVLVSAGAAVDGGAVLVVIE